MSYYNFMRDFSDFIAVDIGNSRLKLLYSYEITTFEIKEGWQENFKKYLVRLINFTKQSLRLNKLTLCISSVNSDTEKQVIGIVQEFRLKILKAGYVLESQKIINFKRVTGMGTDRKLGLIGALEYVNPPLITVDVGTAVTINVLDKKKICRGGVIFPGPYSQVKALAERTEGLSEINLSVGAEVCAKDTETAVSNGIIYGICGSIIEVINVIKWQNPDLQSAKVIMTGGGSKLVRWILRVLEYDFKYEEDLVLRGILKVVQVYAVKKRDEDYDL